MKLLNLFKKPKSKFDIIVHVYANPSCVFKIDRKKSTFHLCNEDSENYHWERNGVITMVYCNYGDELVIIDREDTYVRKI